MRRREFLGGTVVGLVTAGAGCATVSGTRRLSVSLFDASHVAASAPSLTTAQRASLETIRQEGDDVTYGDYPFSQTGDKGYLELDDGFYRVTTEKTDEQPRQRDILFARPDDSPEATANAVPIADAYDEADRERIMTAIEPATHDRHNYAGQHIFRSTSPDDSALLYEPAHKYVEVEVDSASAFPGTALRFDRTRVFRLEIIAGTVIDPIYTTTIDRVATTEGELARHLDEADLVEHVDGEALTDSQRDVLETAIDEGSYVETRPAREGDDPFDGVPLEPRRDPETTRPYQVLRYRESYFTWTVDYTDGV